MRKGGRNLLLYAIVLGLMAAGGAAWYISTAEAAANPTESVVVAKRTIPARTVLTEDLLVMQKVPRGAIHPEAATSMVPFIGKTTKQTIAPSEQILASKLFRNREQAGLSFVLPEGRRAVSISVNERTAAGGLIVPGDRIDVIATCHVSLAGSGTDKGSEIDRTVYSLQYLEVLAVAQDVEGEDAGSPMQSVQPKNADGMLSTSARPQAKPIANTITLALTPEESQKLVLLENHSSCNLRLALRAAGDQARVSNAVVEFNPTASMAPIIGQ
jgi:pilus assembly protein CpaB